MAPKLTVQNAEIKTATVEIQTLSISGKQVTLAVFRQLREEALIAEDCTLIGEPWGIVNYHPDKCDGGVEHVHVVWQRAADLLRARVYAPWAARHENDAAMRFLQAAIYEGLRMKEAPFRGIKGEPRIVVPGSHRDVAYAAHSGVEATFNLNGVQFRGRISLSAARIWASGYVGTEKGDEEALAEWYAKLGCTTDELAALAPAGNYHAAWRTVNELPQLFIAV